MGPSRFTRAGFAVGTIAAMVACADGASSSRFLSPQATPDAITPVFGSNGVPEKERFEICKEYDGAALGPDVSFAVTGHAAPVVLSDGDCAEVFSDGNALVTATETVPAGYTASYVRKVYLNDGDPNTNPDITVEPSVAGNQASGDIGGNPERGVTVVFTNTLIPDDGNGCTYTQGYWKTHSIHGPAGPPDDGWANVGGPDTDFYLSDYTWLELFRQPVKGRKYVSLAHQYMAAKLNVLNGTSSTTAVDAALTAAETFFATAAITDTPPAGLAGILGSYNEGATGPGHCD